MKKKVLMILLLLIAIGTSAVFAQKVGDTVKVGGKDYSIVEVRTDGKLVLAIASLDGVWKRSDNSETVTISGSSGVFTSLNKTEGSGKDAQDKGYFKVGGQRLRNLKSTGNLTWSGQLLNITIITSNPNVATGTNWGNTTITMSEDGKTITVNGSIIFTRQ